MRLMDSPTITTNANGALNPAAVVKPPSPLADADADTVPAGWQGFRRSMTLNEGDSSRRRSGIFFPGNAESPPSLDARRRSSTFSDYSLSEARRTFDHDIINPGQAHQDDEDSGWSSLPLAFAIVPAIAGIMFKNGGSVVTDLILLGLASVFLHWTVTSPLKWYRSAQQVRDREENMAEEALEDSDEGESPESKTPSRSGGLDDVPEEQQQSRSQTPRRSSKTGLMDGHVEQARRALRELYIHEITALCWCFAAPVLGAYLLHTIRAQLTRPSEGLVNNFNLSIFILAAEIRPCSRIIKLVLARTVHLQRIVAVNPHRAGMVSPSQMQQVLTRLDELEATRATPAADGTGIPTHRKGNSAGPAPTTTQNTTKQDAKIVREVRNLIQPELDALNRAVRRYEKKATVLAFQTESRMGAIEARLNDAIALAAAAAKNSSSSSSNRHGAMVSVLDWSGWLVWVVESVVWGLTLPFRGVIKGLLWPGRVVSGLLFGKRGGKKEWHNGGGNSGRSRSRSQSKKRCSTGSVGSQYNWERESQRERERGSGTGSGADRARVPMSRDRGANGLPGPAGGAGSGSLSEKMTMAGQRTGPSSSSSSDRLFGRFGKR